LIQNSITKGIFKLWPTWSAYPHSSNISILYTELPTCQSLTKHITTTKYKENQQDAIANNPTTFALKVFKHNSFYICLCNKSSYGWSV